MPVPGGDRRGGGVASGVPSIPRCGVSSPFKGHMSTKSNAFCIGNSSRLSDQYRIRDHMLVHYNKILNAKAAVDCSVPKSMTKSIKYNDQQRRERLKTAVGRIERESLSSRASSSRPNSRESLDSALQHKDLYNGYGSTLRHYPYSDPGASPTSFISSPRHFRSSEHTADIRWRHPDFSGASSRIGYGLSSSSAWGTSTRKFQDNREKTYSGDLIEKHAHHFTSKQCPFTPRTLKTPAKSALAQSRFYNPPRRKKRETVCEAQVQTDVSSFRGRHQETDRNPPLDGEQDEDPDYSLLSEEEGDTNRHHLSASRISYNELKSPSPTIQRIHSEEEELAYLEFVADVTNEILSLGLFSDRVLDRVFERHLEENRRRLDEGKMRHLLEVLRADLDSKDEKKVDLFADHNFTTSQGLRDRFGHPHAVKNYDFHSPDHSSRSNPRYLDDLKDDVQADLDIDHLQEPNSSLKCLEVDQNNVVNGQGDIEGNQQSTETVTSLPEDELATSREKDDFPFQGDDEETFSQSPDNTRLSSMGDDLQEDHRSSSQMGQSDLLELDQYAKSPRESRDFEDLEQSFSEILQVSKAEDCSVHEEETANVPSDLEDVGDDF